MLIIYTATVILIIFLLQKKKLKYSEFPFLKLKKNGLVFKSTKHHRMEIADAKIMQVGTNVYIKKNGHMFTLKNVDEVVLKNGFLYFKALGIVHIVFNAKAIYRYFNLQIYSKDIDIENLKNKALIDILNNILNLANAYILKKYLKILKNTLKIHINNEKITIKQNFFKISYTIKYKINNKIKMIKVN